MEQWPNFYTVGVTKAGTTTLYAILKEVPGIFLPDVKEPTYFNIKLFPDDHITNPIRKKEEYLDLYKNVKDESIIGDMSPTYFEDSKAPKLIHEVSPQAKILISLRDPVERCYSNYLMHKRNGWMDFSFQKAIQEDLDGNYIPKEPKLFLKQAFYLKYIKNWIKIFGEQNVKIIIFEEFIKNQKQTVNDILKFVNLNYSLDEFTPQIHNAFGIPRYNLSTLILRKVHPKKHSILFPYKIRKIIRDKILLKKGEKKPMDEKDRKFLQEYFEQDVKEVEKFLGRKLPWKNFNS